MRMTQRARRTAVAVVAAVAIGGGGVAVGAATAAPAATITSAASANSATSGPAASVPADAGARASYADVVRQLLPSVVLISTGEGLGSGVELARAGNIVNNAHVEGR